MMPSLVRYSQVHLFLSYHPPKQLGHMVRATILGLLTVSVFSSGE